MFTWLLLVEDWRSWTGAGVVRSFCDTVPRPTRKCFLGQDLQEVRTMEMRGARWPKIVEHPWFGLNDLDGTDGRDGVDQYHSRLVARSLCYMNIFFSIPMLLISRVQGHYHYFFIQVCLNGIAI